MKTSAFVLASYSRHSDVLVCAYLTHTLKLDPMSIPSASWLTTRGTGYSASSVDAVE